MTTVPGVSLIRTPSFAAGGLWPLGVTAFYVLASSGLSVLVAAGIALGIWPASLAIAVAPLALLAYLFLARSAAQRTPLADAIFWAAFTLSIVLPQLQGLTGRSHGFTVELLFVMAAPLTVPVILRLLRESSFFRALSVLLVIFVAFSVLSSVFGRSKPVAAVYQFFTNLKVFVVLLVGFILAWTPRTEGAFWFLIRWLWLPNLLLIGWQWASPGTFFSVYQYANHGADPFGILPSLGVGLFAHQSYLGAFAATATLVCVARATFRDGAAYWLHAGMHFLVLMCAVQRAEIATVVALALLTFLIRGSRKFFSLKVIVIALALTMTAALGWMGARENIQKEAVTWGLEGRGAIWHPRPVMYYYGAGLADRHFPLGSGLGTFGSAGAKLFDRSLYYEFGFARFPWFYSSRTVLMDTYWPNFVAETGWFGGSVMLLMVIMIIGYAGFRARNDASERAKLYWLISFLGLAMLFSISWTSNSFQDPSVILIPGIAFGLAYRMSESDKWRNLARRDEASV